MDVAGSQEERKAERDFTDVAYKDTIQETFTSCI